MMKEIDRVVNVDQFRPGFPDVIPIYKYLLILFRGRYKERFYLQVLFDKRVSYSSHGGFYRAKFTLRAFPLEAPNLTEVTLRKPDVKPDVMI